MVAVAKRSAGSNGAVGGGTCGSGGVAEQRYQLVLCNETVWIDPFVT
jgi:hypothetical protein